MSLLPWCRFHGDEPTKQQVSGVKRANGLTHRSAVWTGSMGLDPVIKASFYQLKNQLLESAINREQSFTMKKYLICDYLFPVGMCVHVILKHGSFLPHLFCFLLPLPLPRRQIKLVIYKMLSTRNQMTDCT